jgi:uncharacterized heparinase superfamily protein
VPQSKPRFILHAQQKKKWEVFGVPINQIGDFNFRGRSPLFIYELHYLEFFAVCDSVIFHETKKRLYVDWKEKFQNFSDPAWDPYPVSRRVINLCKYYSNNSESADWLVPEIALHGSVLNSTIEYHLSCNHLLTNYCALAMVCAVVKTDESSEWFSTAKKGLRQEIRAQFLHDGVHYERSLYYHRVLLWDIFDAICLCGLSILDGDARLNDVLGRAVKAASALSHLDEDVPLFNDSVLSKSPSLKELASYAEYIGISSGDRFERTAHFDSSGFLSKTIASDSFRVLVNSGVLCSKHNLSHHHSDIGSFEVSSVAGRFITNLGTYTYSSGSDRQSFRGGSAHNNLIIPGYGSSDVWGAFRVGRTSRVCQEMRENEYSVKYVPVAHDRLPATCAERVFEFRDNYLTITDKVMSPKCPSNVFVWLHLAPEVRIEMLNGEFLLVLGEQGIRVELLTPADVSIERSEFSPYFEKKYETRSLKISFKGEILKLGLRFLISLQKLS